MFSSKASVIHTDIKLQDEPTTPLYGRPHLNRLRHESQFCAAAHTMNKTVSDRFIRAWSVCFFLTLAVYITIYVGIAVQDLRKDLHLANSPLAKSNFFVVTFMVFTLPVVCRYFLKVLVGALAGSLLGERGYSVQYACLLLAVNLRSDLNMKHYAMLSHLAENGVRIVVAIRLVSDYLTSLGVPFVSLALLVRSVNDQCWMGYHWSWLFFAILWPSFWSFVVLLCLTRFWSSQQCIRDGLTLGISPILQGALDLALVMEAAGMDVNKFSGRWRYGHRVMREEGYLGID
ncbi:Nn.00g063200.m01.CDS01 [Neocucurbitaria sp. VM-36]